MRACWLVLLAIAWLLLTTEATATPPYPALPGNQLLPSGGGSVSSLIGSAPSNTFLQVTGTSPIEFAGLNVPVYIVWYHNAGTPWNTTEKNLVVEWLNNIDTTSWWNFLQFYPSSLGYPASGIHYVSSVDDPENEGTSFSLSGGVDSCNQAVNAAIVSTAFPNTTKALYIVITNDTGVSCPGCGGYHFKGTSVSGASYAWGSFACITALSASFGISSPNGDLQFDNQMIVLSHEVAEAMTYGVTCVGDGSEIGDMCLNGSNAPFKHGALNPSSKTYDVSFTDSGTTYYYWNQAIFAPAQSGGCINGLVSAAQSNLAPCYSGADCPWSKICTNGHCAIPTCSDGVLNQDESDTDCGSTCGMTGSPLAGNCASGKACNTPWDCASQSCLCVFAPGCSCCRHQCQ